MNVTLILRGARENNLKDIDLDLPLRQLIVVSGVSGSGKSTLAFDTIATEAQRRFFESFSGRARRALGSLGRPRVDLVEGLPPALVVGQDAGGVGANPRSTVGTITDLYDNLRLLFARLGHPPLPSMTSSAFSFNLPEGACPRCRGLGVEDRVDPELLVADSTKTLRQGALLPTLPTGYIVYSQVTVDVLDTVCRAHGFDVDTPWQELTAEQREVVFRGSQRVQVPFGKHPLESRLRWKGITAKPRQEGFYKGIVTTLEEIVARSRNKNALRFVRTGPCQACGGVRLRPEARDVQVCGLGIGELVSRPLSELVLDLRRVLERTSSPAVAEAVILPMLDRLEVLDALGLSHLELNRAAATLSRGEAHRLRLATQCGGGLQGVLYVLDEPSVGLHPRDLGRLLAVLRRLRDEGGTPLVVEHAPEAIASADWLVDIGPGPGASGGEVVYEGRPLLDPEQVTEATAARSATVAFAAGLRSIPTPAERRAGQGEILLTGARHNNLKGIDATFRLGTLNVVTGVSGAGKSSLVVETLVPAVTGEAGEARERFDAIRSAERIDKVITIDQAPIGRTPRSNPATYTKVFDRIRDFYASRPEAVAAGLSKGHFSFNVEGGRCEVCQGAGVETVGMHFLGEVAITCPDCQGERFGPAVRAVTYRGRSIVDLLEGSILEASEMFEDAEHRAISRVLGALIELGLGYLRLGQPSTTLSGGEAQRIKLAAQLARPPRGHTLYVLDEPTTGLHQADVSVLIRALVGLIGRGHTVIVVEHDLDVIRAADWVVDLGPGGGREGGRLVVEGTPEAVAAEERSATGRALSPREPSARSAPPVARPPEVIELVGVTTHNLRGVDLELPLGRLTVITGPSGSGKSSLALETLAELGRSRYAERLSAHARRQLERGSAQAEVEAARGLTPTLSIGNRPLGRSPRSTVASMTGVLEVLRLLYARAGERRCPRCAAPLDDQGRCPSGHWAGPRLLLSRHLSFNDESGACPRCRGLGVITTCDPERLVNNPERSLLDGAMDGHAAGRKLADPDGRHLAILRSIGDQLGLDLSKPFRQLDEHAREVALEGTGPKRWEVEWRYKRGQRRGTHRFETTWGGLCGAVNDEWERTHADRRGDRLQALMRKVLCPECGGARLSPGARSVSFAGRTLPELLEGSIEEALAFFDEVHEGRIELSKRRRALADAALSEVRRRLESLVEVGVGYLSLARTSRELSGGEAQRARIAAQLNAGLCGVTYVLDEPTRGLHPRDTRQLLACLRRLRDLGNTLVVVEHDAEVIRAADKVVELGPSGGREGGEVVSVGTPAELAQRGVTSTERLLSGRREPVTLSSAVPEGPVITLRGAEARNLRGLDLELPVSGLVVITGVSGSGKSALLSDVLAASGRSGRVRGCASIEGLERFDAVLEVSQGRPRTAPTACPATISGVWERIRAALTATERARELGFSRAQFSIGGPKGRCPICKGTGRERLEMGFLPDLWSTCHGCDGARFGDETLSVTLAGRSAGELLGLSVAEAQQVLAAHLGVSAELGRLDELGLGYLTLGQPAATLSGGEWQRLSLAAELIRGGRRRQRNLYLLDEPTTGLQAEEVRSLVELLRQLLAAGHGVVAIEHDLEVIAAADFLVDLGPEGGRGGGELVAHGAPAAVAAAERSHTGRALREWSRGF